MTSRLLLFAAAAALSAACVPAPGGQCAADAECRGGTTCQAGLCRAEPVCAAGCGNGLHCSVGLCTPDSPPTFVWLSPADGAVRSGGRLSFAVAVSASAEPASVRVIARAAGAVLLSRPQVADLRADGPAYTGGLDSASLREALIELTPAATVGDRQYFGAPRTIRIDRTGPSLDVRVPVPAGESFRRDESITIRARITDAGAGVDATSVQLLADGMEPVPGVRAAADQWAFALALSKPSFAAVAGPLGFRVVARDLAGNESIASAAVPVTRVLWRVDLGQGLPIAGSPALDRAHVYAGTGSGELFALDRQTGVQLWSRRLAGAISAAPARGKDAVYAASEGGDVVALEPATGALQWNCPDLSGAARFVAAPAVASFANLAGPGAAREGLVLVNDTALPSGSWGGVIAVEGSLGFPGSGGARSCALVGDLGGGASGASIAADGAIFVGTRGAEGVRARKLRAGPDANGLWSIGQEWSARLGDDPTGAPAIGADGSIAFADAGGGIARFDAAGAPLWTPPAALGEKLLAAPIIAFTTLLALGREGTLAPFALGPAASGAASPAFVAQQLASTGDAAATPAAGADGTLYVAAGRSLRALAPGGAVLWEASLPGGATSGGPTLGCDGALYVGDGAGALLALATDSQGLAPGWPRAGHDARGTGNAATPLCE